MASLERSLRKGLEKTVKQARRVAEAGARKALESLAVHHHEPHSSMSPEQRRLRNRLRAHGRQLGDRRDERRGTQAIDRLVGECAYEHWHRMLFARFLAENDLLIEPDSGVAITLPECQELAREKGLDWLELASSYAVRMLPQIFRADDPVLEVSLPPETRSELEDLLKALLHDVFLADDSLGWVYQFWQAEKKDEVNASGNKIGADELPAVTQLFTEDYMVEFLLHNTLGAWWAGKVLKANPELAKNAKDEDELRVACAFGDVRLTYLRFVREENDLWRPAAGTFEGWPEAAKDITLLDPCMGSGHFLVFALPILVALRMHEEGLSEEAAVEAVLPDNLFGLEIDQRCTQIAAFNLALAAWRRVGYRPLPSLNLACSGLAIGVSRAEWFRLAEEVAAASPAPPERDLFGSEENLFSDRIKKGFEALYNLFAKAPWLGSLIDPGHVKGDLLEAGFHEIAPLLEGVLGDERINETTHELAVTAHGITKAAEILAGNFTLVATNVPYLGIRKQDEKLLDYCERVDNSARHDLATVFVNRCLEFNGPRGTIAAVTPQNWLSIGSYQAFRESLLAEQTWNLVALLGTGAFETISGEVVNVGLFIVSHEKPKGDPSFAALDVSIERASEAKAADLKTEDPSYLNQSDQFRNPDTRIVFEIRTSSKKLSDHARCLAGIQNGDSPRYLRSFWELATNDEKWAFQQTAVTSTKEFGGMDTVIDYDLDGGHLRADAKWRREALHDSDQRGKPFWGKRGVLISRMGSLPCALYIGDLYDQASGVIMPNHSNQLPAVWAYCQSHNYNEEVRKLDRKVNVTSATLAKVPFDLEYWQKVAAEKYPNGLPMPHSDDPPQWLFNGHPKGSERPLHASVARLLGYRWPRQAGSSFADCPALEADGLEAFADEDGIVCLDPIQREATAADRLTKLLSAACGNDWSAAKLNQLLADAGLADKTLNDWLCDGFFEQHSALFHHRPFIWHIWDGLRDGFNALVNYHKLAAPNGEGRRTLEKLIYTYLGDWITQQRRDQQAGVEGAGARVAAAVHLQNELKKILEGELPYDIFVRWKPLHEQPIGWDPDINDGVRLNIRPFMTARPLGARAKNACIFRTTPKNIKWKKDRGKDPERPKEDYPWFWGWDEKTQDFTGGKTFDGNRWNDLHYTNAVKQAARDRRNQP